jgi:hypothetical protein
MDLSAVVKAVALVALLAPVLLLLVTVFVLVPLALIQARPSTVSRVTFECPVSRRQVHAAFATSPTADKPSDVLACSLFGDGPVTCRKGCLEAAVPHWGPPTAFPRFALLAGGEAYRNSTN